MLLQPGKRNRPRCSSISKTDAAEIRQRKAACLHKVLAFAHLRPLTCGVQPAERVMLRVSVLLVGGVLGLTTQAAASLFLNQLSWLMVSW